MTKAIALKSVKRCPLTTKEHIRVRRSSAVAVIADRTAYLLLTMYCKLSNPFRLPYKLTNGWFARSDLVAKKCIFYLPLSIWRPRFLGFLWNFAVQLTMRKLDILFQLIPSHTLKNLVEFKNLLQIDCSPAAWNSLPAAVRDLISSSSSSFCSHLKTKLFCRAYGVNSP